MTQKDGTSTVKSDGIRFSAALEVVPESSAAFYGFHGDAGPRECCRPTALDVVKLQSDDKRVIIQTKVGLFLHRHAKCATQCVSVRIPWPQKLVEIRRTKAQTRPPAGSSKTYFPVWLQVQQTTNPITRWTFYCPFEVFSYFFSSFFIAFDKECRQKCNTLPSCEKSWKIELDVCLHDRVANRPDPTTYVINRKIRNNKAGKKGNKFWFIESTNTTRQ